jgi:hypothetical protein
MSGNAITFFTISFPHDTNAFSPDICLLLHLSLQVIKRFCSPRTKTVFWGWNDNLALKSVLPAFPCMEKENMKRAIRIFLMTRKFIFLSLCKRVRIFLNIQQFQIRKVLSPNIVSPDADF